MSMDAALYGSALALGLAGAPHCVAMCAAPCAAVTCRSGPAATAAFHLARVAGYAAAGALAALSINALGMLGNVSPMFRPLWSMVHAAALALGLWLLITGRQPEWVERIGRGGAGRGGPGQAANRAGWQAMRGPGRAAAAGALWVAWPCGLLQSAVLVAGLANTGWHGAGVMATFAMASGLALTAAPWLWRHLGRGSGALLAGGAGVRVAGAMLAGASIWALGRDLWPSVAAYCGL
jgi:uncharacterized protein